MTRRGLSRLRWCYQSPWSRRRSQSTLRQRALPPKKANRTLHNAHQNLVRSFAPSHSSRVILPAQVLSWHFPLPHICHSTVIATVMPTVAHPALPQIHISHLRASLSLSPSLSLVTQPPPPSLSLSSGLSASHSLSLRLSLSLSLPPSLSLSLCPSVPLSLPPSLALSLSRPFPPQLIHLFLPEPLPNSAFSPKHCLPSLPFAAMPRISRLQAAAERFKNPLQLNQQAADPPLNEPLTPLQRSHCTSQGTLRPPHLCLPHNLLLHEEIWLNPLSQNWTSHPQTLPSALKSSKDATQKTPMVHTAKSAGTMHIIMHHPSCQVIFDSIQKCLPATKNSPAFTNTAQPLHATTPAPVELRPR